MFKEKRILITGGTGSFGNEVIKLFLKSDIKEIRVFSRDEKKQEDLRLKYLSDKLNFFIGDVRDYSSIVSAMKNVDYVFHAAALKQVPSCEFFPIQAVKTNVFGTENVINCAIENGVSKIICLSTDKAAYPVNAMGISKAMMEKVALAKSRDNNNETLIAVTRYGNVMASRGSVIPLFINQIKSGKNITVTEPNMTRFLMSLEEAVVLVLFAFEKAISGDIMVQKAPGCKVGDLALAIKELFETDTEINVIGSRHSEKLYETLLTKEEKVVSEDLGSFFRVPLDIRNLNYQQYQDTVHKEPLIEDAYNSHNTNRLNIEQIKEKLLSIPYVINELSNWKRRR
jgi:UDP-N-acetylglucosamine 4,6-dehydratase